MQPVNRTYLLSISLQQKSIQTGNRGSLQKKIINIDPEGIQLIDKDWSQKRPAVETASLFCGDGEIRTLVQTRN